MKSSIANFALSLVLLSTTATLTTAIPAPLPAATGYSSNSEEASLAADARANLRPVWRPGPRIDETTPTGSPSSGLSARQGPVFRRNAESKFQYRKRTSAGLAVAGNLAYGLGERDIASPFGIGGGDNHVPLPVAMRVRRQASLMERDDDEEEDWDCSDDDDDEEDEGDDQEEQWSSSTSSSEAAPWTSSEAAKEEPQSLSSAAAPAPSNDSSNQNANAPNPLLTNNVVGTKKEDGTSDSQEQAPAPSSSSQQEASSKAAYIAPAPESTESINIFLPQSTKKSSLKKTHSKSKSKATTPTLLTTPSDIAPGTLTVEQGCTRYHTVVSGEVCLGLLDWSKDLSLTLEQLYSYNPAIDAACMNLQIGWGVCIGANPANATSTPTSSLLRKRNVQ